MMMDGASTISEYIELYNIEEITFPNFFLKMLVSTPNGEVQLLNSENIYQKYIPELNKSKKKVILTNDEYQKYRFNPKRLSYDIYGTTELWFMILNANELHSISEFDIKTIYLYDTSLLRKMSKIINLESNARDFNEAEIIESLN